MTQAEAMLPVETLPWKSRGVTAGVTKPHAVSGEWDVDSTSSWERTAHGQEMLFTENMIHHSHQLGNSLGAKILPESQTQALARKGQHRPYTKGVASLSEGPHAIQEC